MHVAVNFPKTGTYTVRVDNPEKVYGNIGGISGQNEMIINTYCTETTTSRLDSYIIGP
jgi:hypothetical protein